MVTSHKKTEKSNIRIGIFCGKSANYNLAILETLFQKQATTWQIADALQKNIKPTRGKDAMYYRKQKIYSVIQRKKGRLADLKEKGYIKETNGKWRLTRKGLIALSIKRPDFVTSGLQTAKSTFANIFKEYLKALPSETLREPLGIRIDISKFKPYLERIDPTSMLIKILKESKDLLSQGIKLDTISEEDLFDIVIARSARRISENTQ